MDLEEIRTDARYLVSPQLNDTDYPDEDLDRNANRWYKLVIGWIIPIQGDWEVSGDLLYQDFQAGVTTYDVPQKLLRIIKAEVMYETGGSFVPVTFRDIRKNQSEVEGNAARIDDNAAAPVADLFGDVIEVRPAPTETVINGFKIWVQMDFEDLDEEDNPYPDLLEPVKRVISAGAALDYAIAEEMDKKEISLKRMIFGDPRVPDDRGLKGVIEDLYANRSGARRDRLTAKKQSYK